MYLPKSLAEYINCIYAERKDFPNECPGYKTKQSEGALGNADGPFIDIALRSALSRSCSN